MVQRAAFPVLLLTALLSGCVAEADDGIGHADGSAPAGIPAGEPAEGDGAGTAATHGQADRTDSDVTVTREGSQYVARKTVTLTNDFGGASHATMTLKTVNGGVEANAWDDGGYRTVARLSARATSEQEARDNLARLKVTHTDQLSNGRLTLSTVIAFPANVNNLGGSLESDVPREPSYILNLATTNGGIGVGGLGGSSVAADTTNGGIDLQSSFNSVTLTTSNGGVVLDGTFNRGTVDTTNGGISGDIRSTASGSWDLETTNGGIDVDFDATGAGYDAEGSCTNGGIDLSFPGAEAVGTQSRTEKLVRTGGFSSKAIQVTIDASTTNGDVELSG